MGGARRTTGWTIVGAGRLARVFGPALAEAGIAVRLVVARRAGAARRLARLAGGALSSTRLDRAAAASDAVLIAVSDGAIWQVAHALALARPAGWESRVVLHCAGALGPEALEPLARAGASVGVLHPLQCLGETAGAPSHLVGARARVEGDPAARSCARHLARRLGLVVLRPQAWDDDRRVAYHAAAALVSNDLVALMGDAVALLEQAGFAPGEALAALLPLSRGTLEIMAHAGVDGALTGPAVRGDHATVRAHLARLRRLSPDTATAHHGLSRRLSDRARPRTGQR